jgi:hypothetical protein
VCVCVCVCAVAIKYIHIIQLELNKHYKNVDYYRKVVCRRPFHLWQQKEVFFAVTFSHSSKDIFCHIIKSQAVNKMRVCVCYKEREREKHGE